MGSWCRLSPGMFLLEVSGHQCCHACCYWRASRLFRHGIFLSLWRGPLAYRHRADLAALGGAPIVCKQTVWRVSFALHSFQSALLALAAGCSQLRPLLLRNSRLPNRPLVHHARRPPSGVPAGSTGLRSAMPLPYIPRSGILRSSPGGSPPNPVDNLGVPPRPATYVLDPYIHLGRWTLRRSCRGHGFAHRDRLLHDLVGALTLASLIVFNEDGCGKILLAYVLLQALYAFLRFVLRLMFISNYQMLT